MSGTAGDEAPGGPAAAWRIITLVMVGLLGVAVAAALVITLGEANRQRDRALSAQAHSYDVMILARMLAGTIARSEASLGRYVISADKGLGQQYVAEWRSAGAQIERLARLTRDNDVQAPAIAALRDAYAARGDELSLTALSTNWGKNSQALARFYRAREGASLAAIGRTLDEIIAHERRLLAARTDEAMASVAWSTRAAGVLAVFGILLLLGALVLGWLTVKATAERAQAEADADAAQARAEELSVAVAQATETLREQEARLHQVQKIEAVGQLTGGIAHDFNNMLAVVLGGLELARKGAAAGRDVTRHIDSATEGANRAAALTRQLLAFARENALNPEPIDAGGLIAGMRDLLDRTLGDGVRVVVTDESSGWRVLADRVQLENAVLNLAVNARDAMAGRGVLTIAARAITLADDDRDQCGAGDHLVIEVSDTGCGMSAEVAARVFEPFFTTKPVGKGTGLGLSQIFGFVRQMGGEVSVDTAPGAGTTVSLCLPRAAAEPPRIELVASEPAPAAAGPLSVLVVEDDPRVLEATVGALEDLGHAAIRCGDPFAAPDLLDRHPAIDLILTDVLMPGRTGPEMIAALPARHAHLAVLYVTGFAGEGGGAPAELAGRQVLRKPFTIAGLERAIGEAVADRPAPPRSLAAA